MPSCCLASLTISYPCRNWRIWSGEYSPCAMRNDRIRSLSVSGGRMDCTGASHRWKLRGLVIRWEVLLLRSGTWWLDHAWRGPIWAGLWWWNRWWSYAWYSPKEVGVGRRVARVDFVSQWPTKEPNQSCCGEILVAATRMFSASLVGSFATSK